MNAPEGAPGLASGDLTRARWRGWARVLVTGLGLALLVGAILLALRDGGALREVFASGRLSKRWPLVAAMLILPLLNYACSVALLLVLTRPYVGEGKVLRAREMAALVGAAWLVNYLPFAPGLFGRAAYHARFHGVPLTRTGRVVIESIVLGGAALVLWVGVCFLMSRFEVGAVEIGLVFLLAGAAMSILPSSWIGWMLRAGSGARADAATTEDARGAARGPGSLRYAAAFVIRFVDVGVWSLRYAAAFGLLGYTIAPATSVMFAIVSQLAVLVPLLGNGLGIREWAVGVGAGLTAQTPDGTRGFVSPLGISADVLNRGAELMVAIPVGVVSLAWLAAAWRRADSPNPAGPDDV